MKNLVEQHQIAIFFVLTFLFSWFPWYAGIAPEVLTLGPSVVAFVVVLIVGGRGGLVEWLRPFGRFRVGLKWWGIAIFGPAILYLLGLGVYLLMGNTAPPFIMLREELNLVPLYLIMMLLPWYGPIGEEFGWRGFALPRLQFRYGPLIASLIIGTAWGLWHLPSFFAPQDVIGVITATIGLIFIVPYVLGTIANSIIMTWLYNKTNASALIAGIVWHAMINFWAPVLLSDSSLRAAQEGTQLPTIAPALYLTVVAVQVAAAIALVFVTSGRLGMTSATEEAEASDELSWMSG